MVAQLPWPILGVVIPCVVIAFLGYGSHFFLWYDEPRSVQWTHQIMLHAIWLTYALAIFTDAGSPKADYHPPKGQWKRWCQKCEAYKPERSHHCKICKKCVLVMDHHCPWTYNCVGHNNLPQFLRFLVAVILGTGHHGYLLWQRIYGVYELRNEPAYLISKWKLFWVLFFTVLNFAVFLSIFLLYIRCLLNIISGKSQIEVWEWERLESQFSTERFWLQVRSNYRKMHGKEMPKLESCRFLPREDVGEIVPVNFTIDDLIFPYDYGFWNNIVYFCGQPWTWLFPWGRSPVNGWEWPLSTYMEDDQLGLPWPPDGGQRETVVTNDHVVDTLDLSNPRNVALARKRLNPLTTASRNEWINDHGENLGDYGVDMDVEVNDEEIES